LLAASEAESAYVKVLLYFYLFSLFFERPSLILGVLFSLCLLVSLMGDFGLDLETPFSCQMACWLWILLNFCWRSWLNSMSAVMAASWLAELILGVKWAMVNGVRAILLSPFLFSRPEGRLVCCWLCWRTGKESICDWFVVLCWRSCVKVKGLVDRF
jgi:hypothetical protein